MLKIGIIGLPNVGKSTLFNLITNSKAEEANYPFTTIEPNIGIVEVPDERMEKLVKIFQPNKVIKPLIKFWDIAGLVKGASEGIGLGNKFLSHIRETTILVHVVRLFEDKNILKEEKIDPLEDLKTINLELIISDLEVMNKKWKILSKPKKSISKERLEIEKQVCKKVINVLNENKMLYTEKWLEDEFKIIKEWSLLTIKKTLVLINVSDDFFLKEQKNMDITKFLDEKKIDYIFMPIVFEKLLLDFSEEEKQFYREEKNILKNTFNVFLRIVYKMLDLATFFTCGKEEVKGWTFKIGKTAPECAGIIHSDFQKGFIRCEVINSKDLIELGSEQKVKEQGKLKVQGKNYVIKDGDVCHFLFNV